MQRRLSSTSSIDLIQLDTHLEINHRIKSNSLVEMFDPIYEKQFQNSSTNLESSLENSSSSEDIFAPKMKSKDFHNASHTNAFATDDLFQDFNNFEIKEHESIYPSLSSFARSFSTERYSVFEKQDPNVNDNITYDLRPSLFKELTIDSSSNLFNDGYANKDMENFMKNVTELHMESLTKGSHERDHLIFDMISLNEMVIKEPENKTIEFNIIFSNSFQAAIEPHCCKTDVFNVSERELLLQAINQLCQKVEISNLFFRIFGRGEYLKQGEFPLIQNQSVFQAFRDKSDMKLILENIDFSENKYQLKESISTDTSSSVYRLLDSHFYSVSREYIETGFAALNSYRNDIVSILRGYRLAQLDLSTIDASFSVFVDKCKSLCVICHNIYTAEIAQQIIESEKASTSFFRSYSQTDDSALSSLVENLIKNLDKSIRMIVQMINEIAIFCNCNFSVKSSQLCLAGCLNSETGSQSISKCKKIFSVKLNSICCVKDMDNYSSFYVKLTVKVGHLPLSQFLNSRWNSVTDTMISQESIATKIHPKFPKCITFNATISFDNLSMNYLTMETCLSIEVFGRRISSSDSPKISEELIGWTEMALFDSAGMLKQGKMLIGLWVNHRKLKSSHGSNRQKAAPVLQIELPDFHIPVKYICDSSLKINEIPYLKPTQKESNLLEKFINNMWLDSNDKVAQNVCDMLWKHRGHLLDSPRKYIALCLSLVSSWPNEIQSDNKDFLLSYLDRCDFNLKDSSFIEILYLLGPHMPLIKIRRWAVEALQKIGPDSCISIIPWLVEALKYDLNLNSSGLENLLLDFSIMNINFATNLFWQLNSINATDIHGYDAILLLGMLMSLVNNAIFDMWNLQLEMVNHLKKTAESVKAYKGSTIDRKITLHTNLEELYDLISKQKQSQADEGDHPLCTYRIPYHPGLAIHKLEMKDCSYFNSFTLPLRIVFKGIDEILFEVMFKSGDDLRQDILVLQLFKLMDDIWTNEGLNLRMVHYQVMNTGVRSGLVELVGDCTTLRKIQENKGIAAPLTSISGISEWLKCQNTTKAAYIKSVNNFLLTCAAYCVSTYLLGIGDRHNDNIMIQTSGCIFHIDFAKILGDAQTFAGIRRDRVPFVLTQDMVHVLEDYQPHPDDRRTGMQLLIDKCCEAYNIIRRHWTSLISVLSMAAAANIPGVNNKTIQYVVKMLRLDYSDIQASEEFTDLIKKSLNSISTPMNFFIHNLAQMKYSSNNEGSLFSFTPKICRNGPRITNVSVKYVKKVRTPNKYYTYEIWIQKENSKKYEIIFRKFEHFLELGQHLATLFPLSILPKLFQCIFQQGPPNNIVAAESRKQLLNHYIGKVLLQKDEISQCDLMKTFFNSILSDEQFREESGKFLDCDTVEKAVESSPEIQLKFHWSERQSKLEVFVKHARNLKSPRLTEPPNSYVKTYILPGYSAKRKTSIVMRNSSPSFNDIITYPNITIKPDSKIEISIWHNEVLGENFCLGSIVLSLANEISNEEKWYKLKSLSISDSERLGTSLRVANQRYSEKNYSATMPASRDRKQVY